MPRQKTIRKRSRYYNDAMAVTADMFLGKKFATLGDGIETYVTHKVEDETRLTEDIFKDFINDVTAALSSVLSDSNDRDEIVIRLVKAFDLFSKSNNKEFVQNAFRRLAEAVSYVTLHRRSTKAQSDDRFIRRREKKSVL